MVQFPARRLATGEGPNSFYPVGLSAGQTTEGSEAGVERYRQHCPFTMQLQGVLTRALERIESQMDDFGENSLTFYCGINLLNMTNDREQTTSLLIAIY